MKTFKDFLPEGWDTSSLNENAEELNIGDDVIITGKVEFNGCTGVIADFGSNKSFVVVNLYNHGKHSFHSSDVSANDYAGSDDERSDMYDNDEDFRDWQHEHGDIDEGIVSDIKRGVKKLRRGVAGWGGVEDSPKELVARNKAHDDDTLRRLNRAANTPLDFPFNGTPSEHSPAGLQKRVLGKEMKKRGLVGEATRAPSAWRDWDPENYNSEEEVLSTLSAAILAYVQEEHGGQAWFKGGSYAYKIDSSKPNVMVASDGSVVKVENIAKGLADYCDRYTINDFIDTAPVYWDEYFRPVKDPNRLAKDGAPMHGSDQAEHEYNNMMGESVDNLVDIKRLAGLK